MNFSLTDELINLKTQFSPLCYLCILSSYLEDQFLQIHLASDFLQIHKGPPTEMQGTLRTLTNGYIGPVPAEDTLIIAVPKTSLADSSTCFTNGSLIDVLAGCFSVYDLCLYSIVVKSVFN